ncbi:MAG TPA: hypothetical protein VEQ42_06685 [Pyrinomonadaceae bacterium]|nr:hypothetical protein [Pyrinomonadaceae bacterium]
MRAVEHERAADDLDEVRAFEACGERRASLLRVVGGRVEDFDFDEFARVESVLDGARGRVGDALLADVQEGFEVVRERAQVRALFGAERCDCVASARARF